MESDETIRRLMSLSTSSSIAAHRITREFLQTPKTGLMSVMSQRCEQANCVRMAAVLKKRRFR
jgi:hypothetical protein